MNWVEDQSGPESVDDFALCANGESKGITFKLSAVKMSDGVNIPPMDRGTRARHVTAR